MVIFSVLLFLTPTVAMYYYTCFSVLIVSILSVQILLLNLQNISNNFPYFLLAFTLRNPYCLPNSIRFQLSKDKRTLKLVPNKSRGSAVFHRLSGDFFKII
mmetsp:Transcript_37652/g.27758  ORF Transcript_37652/g.27758 Transcript_37652/m.27758 type:complete len:101 (+) Transcript_37652:881-1183(+)